MHKTIILGLTFGFAAGLMGCQGNSPSQTASEKLIEEPAATSNIQIKSLADNVWLHTSYYEFPGGDKALSNGLAVANGDELILIDTAWGELATKALVEKLKAETGLTIKKAVITNFHYDRLAGVDYLEEQGVTIFTHPDTPGLSAALGTPIPNTSVASLKEPGSRRAIGPIEIAYPGPAHSPENLVVYIKASQILFGGSAVRGPKHTSLGNIADADLSKWGPSLNWVKSTYKDTRMVVPSHGQVGNVKLLDHTLKILARTVNAQNKASDDVPEAPSKP